MRGTEPAIETTMLPGMIEVQTLVPAVVTDPVATLGVDVRRVRVTGLIVEIALFVLHGSRRIRFRLMQWLPMRPRTVIPRPYNR